MLEIFYKKKTNSYIYFTSENLHNLQFPVLRLYDSASLIQYEPRYIHRKFKVALHIQKCNNNLNENDGLEVSPM